MNEFRVSGKIQSFLPQDHSNMLILSLSHLKLLIVFFSHMQMNIELSQRRCLMTYKYMGKYPFLIDAPSPSSLTPAASFLTPAG